MSERVPPRIYGKPVPNAPCKECKERHSHCHAECEKYRAFAAERYADYNERKKFFYAQAQADSYAIEKTLRLRKNYGRKK